MSLPYGGGSQYPNATALPPQPGSISRAQGNSGTWAAYPVPAMPPLEPCSPGWGGGGGGWRPQAARLQVSFGVLQALTPRPGSSSRCPTVTLGPPAVTVAAFTSSHDVGELLHRGGSKRIAQGT